MESIIRTKMHYGDHRSRREREMAESPFNEIMVENFPKLWREMYIQRNVPQGIQNGRI